MLTSDFLKDYPGFDEPEYEDRLAKMFRKDKKSSSPPKIQNIRENTPSSDDKEKEAQEILGSYDFERHIKSLFESRKLTPRPGSLIHFFNSSFGDGHSHYAAFKTGDAGSESGDFDARLERFYIGNEMILDRQVRPNTSRLARPCENCGSDNRLSDLERGESFCGDCGTVSSKIFNRQAAVKVSSSYSEFMSKLHHQPADVATGLGTIRNSLDITLQIMGINKNRKYWQLSNSSKYHLSDLRNRKEFSKSKVHFLIDGVGNSLGASPAFTKRVKDYFAHYYKKGEINLKIYGSKETVGALFHLVSLEDGRFNIPLEDISQAMNLERHAVSKAYIRLTKTLDVQHPPSVTGYVNYFSNKLGLEEDVKKRALELSRIRKEVHLSPTVLAGAIIYQAKIDCGKPMRQIHFSKIFGITGVSLSNALDKLGFHGKSYMPLSAGKDEIPDNYKEKILPKLKISDVCQRLGLSPQIAEKAEKIYSTKKWSGRTNHPKVKVAAIHLASRVYGDSSVPIEEIIKHIPVPNRGIFRICRLMANELKLKFTNNPPEHYINFYASKLGLDKDSIRRAYDIAQKIGQDTSLTIPHHVAVSAIYKTLTDSGKELDVKDLNVYQGALRRYLGEDFKPIKRVWKASRVGRRPSFASDEEAMNYISKISGDFDFTEERKNEAIEIWKKISKYKFEGSLRGKALAAIYHTVHDDMSIQEFAKRVGYTYPNISVPYSQLRKLSEFGAAPQTETKMDVRFKADVQGAWQIMRNLKKAGVTHIDGKGLAEFVSTNLYNLRETKLNSTQVNILDTELFDPEHRNLILPSGQRYSIGFGDDKGAYQKEEASENPTFYFGHTHKVEIKVTDRFHYLPTEQERNKFLEAVSRYSEVPVKDLENALREEHGWEKDRISSTQDYLHQTGAIEIEIRKTSRKEVPIKLVKLSAYGDKNPKET